MAGTIFFSVGHTETKHEIAKVGGCGTTPYDRLRVGTTRAEVALGTPTQRNILPSELAYEGNK